MVCPSDRPAEQERENRPGGVKRSARTVSPRRGYQVNASRNLRTRSRGEPVGRLVASRSKEPRWNGTRP